MANSLAITATPTSAELASIGDNLARFNDDDVGSSERLALVVLLRDDAGAVVGGLSGYTAWGWLYVQWLWLADDQRGGGWAGRMLAAAEEEARDRGCHGAHIDTFNPVALKVYQRQGYAVFGQLPDFPKGRTRSFLMKML